MSKAETGWTKEFPRIEGVYWARRSHDRPEPQMIRVWEHDDDWYVYRFGDGRDIEAGDFIKTGYEYLGPVTPADAEQLSELRRLTRHALGRLESDHVGPSLHRLGLLGADDVRSAVEFLRKALNPKQPEKETQEK